MKKKITLARKQHPEFDAARTREQSRILERGVSVWNEWRASHPDEYIDLRRTDWFGKLSLHGVNLHDANLSEANFARADLRGADLSAVFGLGADFQGARLERANLQGAVLEEAKLNLAGFERADLRLTDMSGASLLMASFDGANLRAAKIHSTHVVDASFAATILAKADLDNTVLRGTDMSGANLRESCLDGVTLIDVNLDGADLSGSHVFGTSVWRTKLDGARQENLVITPRGEPDITVDNIRVAQFVYSLLNNSEIRAVIDTITSKVVLILGRFTPERKAVLDAVREELRKWNYTPIMFDFRRPGSRDLLETVNTLAGMSRFVIADFTDAKVVLDETRDIVSAFPSIPIQPLLLRGAETAQVMVDFERHPTFLPLYRYASIDELLTSIEDRVIAPAEAKAREISEHLRRSVYQPQ